jgi:hypothetical protein
VTRDLATKEQIGEGLTMAFLPGSCVVSNCLSCSAAFFVSRLCISWCKSGENGGYCSVEQNSSNKQKRKTIDFCGGVELVLWFERSRLLSTCITDSLTHRALLAWQTKILEDENFISLPSCPVRGH